MGKFVRSIAVIAGLSLGLGVLSAQAELPAIKISEAALVTPSNAISYYDNAVDPCPVGTCYRILETPLEVIELAKALGANRLSDSEFAKNVYEYVYQNISVTPIFGLQEGSLGAILDQSGTTFDQAQLMVDLLKQDTTVAPSVSYKFGTITLPELEVAKWFGVAYKKNGNVIFNSVALQKVMANGGVPALFSGGNVTLSHIWVAALGNEYDPSYKKFKFYEGIDLASAMGCGTDANPLCGDDALTVAIPSNYLLTNNVQNVNNTGLDTKLKLYGTNLISYLDAHNAYTSKEEIIGGFVIDHDQIPDKAHVATRTSSISWTAIPNQYRTTFSVMFDNTYGKFFADEVVGKRVRLFGEMGVRSGNVASRKTTLYVEYNIVSSSIKTAGSVDNDDVILMVDHPYAAKADSLSASPIALDGTYMDQTLVQKTFAQYEYIDNDPGTIDPYYFHAITVIHGFGGTGPAALTKMQNIQTANNYVLDVPVPSDPDHLYNKCQEKSSLRGYVTSPNVVTEINSGCLDLLTPSVVATWLVQVEKYRKLVSEINNSSIQIHHSLGNSTLSTLNIESGMSVEGNTNDPVDKITASHSFASGISRLEGGMLEQLSGEWEGDSAVGLFLRSNDKGHNFLRIDSSNKATLLPTLTNYSQARKTLIEAYIDSGHVVILPQNGIIGTFTLTSLASRSINSASFFAYKAADHSSLAYIVDAGFKGSGAGEEDPSNKVLETLRLIDSKNNVLKPYSVNQVNGELTLKMPPDIITGSGSFPYSLPFVRTYSSQENILPIRMEPFILGGRLASGIGSTLRGGWKHNYEITANITSDALQAMGADSAKDAWSTIVALVTLRDLNSQSHTIQNILTSIFVTDWWGRGLQDNAIQINGAGASGVYIKLPDGNSFNPPLNSVNKLTQTNNRVGPLPGGSRTVFYYGNITLSLTTSSGEIMQFSIGGTGIDPTSGVFNGRKNFIIDNWSFPSGVVLNFGHETRTVSVATYGGTTPIEDIYLPNKITNNLGRSLTFGLMDVNNESSRIGYVEDDQLRRVSYPVGATGEGSNNGTRSIISTRGIIQGTSAEYDYPSFRVKRLDNTEEIYNYTSTTHSPYVQNSMAQITGLYLPGNINTPFLTASYDGLDRIKTVTDASGNINNYYIGSIGINKFSRGEEVNPLGNQFVNYFNYNGRVVKSIDPLGRVTKNDYDGVGRLIKTTLPEGDATAYSYDVRHNRTQVKQIAKVGSGLADIVSSTTYMEGASVLTCSNMKTCNKPATVTDAKGNVTSYTYQSTTGNMLTETKPAIAGVSPVTTLAYNTYGQVTSITDPLAMVSTFTYDTLANHSVLKTTVTDSGTGRLNLTTAFTYDAVGNVLTVDKPRTDVTDVSTFQYDVLRRITKSIAPDGSFGKNIFDLDGQLIRTEKYALGGTVPLQVSETDYTLTGQVDKTYGPECFDAAGVRNTLLAGCNVTATSYDVLDRPDIVTDGEGRKTQTLYYADSKPHKIIKALGTAIQQDNATYTYTTNGKEASVMDANGNVTQYQYDGFDQLDKFLLPSKNRICSATSPCTTASPNLPDGTDYEQYTYDNNGNMTIKRKRDAKTITMAYDALNRVTSKSPQGQTAVNYTYDLASRQTDVDFATGGHLIHHTYDTAGRLTATSDNGRILSYTYDGAGNRTKVGWPDGYSADYAYDALNRVSTIKENNLATLATYAYDTAGRRMSVTLGNGNITSYSYYGDDALNTLSHNVGGAADDVNWTYGFNKVNQLTSKVISNALYQWHPLYTKSDTYTSNGLNQYSAVANSTLTYDANGNLTGDNVWLYIYDTENMLLGASRAGTSSSYLYDPMGRRSVKTVDGVLTTFLNDGVEEIADYNSTGTLLRRYVHGPGVDEYLVMYTGTGTTNKSYFHANHQGSIVAMSDSAGTVTEQHSYDSYGNSDDLTGNPFRYTGRRLDAETGLYYYRARYYSPAIGRFLQTDPIGYGDGLNWYAYVGNDPVNGTDPRGEFVQGLVAGAVGFVVGTAVNATVQYLSTGKVDISDAVLAGGAAGLASAAIAINPALAANPAALAALGGTLSVGSSVAQDVANGKDVSLSKAAVAGVAGAIATPLGASLGNVVENALGATSGSIAGEIAGASIGEGAAAGINAAVPAAAESVETIGNGIVQSVKELANPDNFIPSPKIEEER